MSKSWPFVALGEVLTHRKEFIQINDLETYKRCRVQLHAQGIVLRDSVAGVEIKTKKQQVCQAGDFLVAEIDAKVGGFGIVPDELDKAIVSSHYFLFGINDAKLDRRFLDFYSKTLAFREQVAAQGSTNYAAIRPINVLGYTIPLPPLAEQQRIVARIEDLAVKIHEARGLRQQAVEETEALIVSYAHRYDLDSCKKLAQGWLLTTLSDVVTLVQDLHKVQTDTTYPNIGIFSYARGLFKKPHIAGLQTSATYLNRVHAGQFIYSRLFAFEGAYGMVNDEFDNYFVSNEYPTFNCNTEKVLPEFLYAYFKSPTVWKDVAVGSKGLGDRRQRVQPQQILTHRFMLPPIEYQYGLRQLMAKAVNLKRLHSETAAEFDAMLPSILDKAFKGEL